MSAPTQTCALCGQQVTVTPDGRGFPPDIAKRKLKKLCAATGCPSDPTYRVGIRLGGLIIGQAAPTPARPGVRPAGESDG